MGNAWRKLTGDGRTRGIGMLLAAGGVMFCSRGFTALSLPSAGEGAATGLFDLIRQTAGAGGILDCPAAAGLLFCVVLLTGALHREFLELLARRATLSRGRLAGRLCLAAGPAAVFVWVVVLGGRIRGGIPFAAGAPVAERGTGSCFPPKPCPITTLFLPGCFAF